MRLIILAAVLSFLFIGSVKAQDTNHKDSLWVDSVFTTMSRDERIEQLFMVKVYTCFDKKYYESVSKQICDYKVGGVAFFKGNPYKQALWTNEFQLNANIPLLVGIDGEWGLAMRLDSTPYFPRQIALGAIQNNSLIFEMGVEIARECKRMGIHMNFAPVVDINSNPKNPIINSRSFGESKYNVANKGLEYMLGMQSLGIFACAKHFPGHGDTDTDSHLDLPVIKHSKETIDTLDLFPFRELIKNNVASIMVAHLNVPSLDTSAKSISSLSKPIITDLLENQMGFKGLVISDALEMKGVSNIYKDGTAELQALIAGNDMLLLPQNLNDAIKAIRTAIDSSIITQIYVDEKCRKILHLKYKAGLNEYMPIKTKNLFTDLNTSYAKNLQNKLVENTLTLVKNNNNILPLKKLDTLCLASLSIGDTVVSEFQKVMSRYASIDNFYANKKIKKSEVDSLISILKNYSYVIVSIQNTTNLANENFGISNETIAFIDTLKDQNKIILDIFANPYSLGRFENTDNIDALIVSYQDNIITENLSAQLIFGAITATGKLPVTSSAEFPLNTGIPTLISGRLKYTTPYEVGIDEKDLLKIDSLANLGIASKAFPGCVILVAKDGKVFYNKAFGSHTYDNKVPTLTNDIFDMASITKIEASTMAIMKLVDDDKLNLDAHLVDYLPYLKGTNKAHIIIRDLLAHQARLKAWIPFYKETIKNGKIDTNIYHKIKSAKYPYRVADSLYIRKDYPDTIMMEIIKSPLNKKKEYIYSDMGFYLMMKIVEEISDQSFETFVQDNFYAPLGMGNTSFSPRDKFLLNRIVPTEIDTAWRKQLVWGDVNDQGAAMMGGVSGHAGLFSNAYDLATIMQMMLQKGEYAGKRYLKDSTVEEFTKYQFPENDNRRGLGFDKPALNKKETGPCCDSASSASYGHSGFTGTFFWVDPKENLVYIFLSNRVHPDPNNKKLTEMGIRTNIQQVIYDAIAKSKLKNN